MDVNTMSAPARLGAFYQCHGQPKSFLRALGSFRYHYPTGTIKIVSDGGLAFEKAATCFDGIYERGEQISHRGTYFSTSDQLLQWIGRLLDACKMMREDYVLILEDDVRILQPVRSQLDHDLNGINPSALLGEHLTKFLSERNPKLGKVSDSPYGGCGGSILRKEFLVTYFKNVEQAIGEIAQHAKPDLAGPFPSDYYLTALVLYYGGSIGGYAGYDEKHWPDYQQRAAANNIEVLHQEKSFYHVPLEPWEAALFGRTYVPPDHRGTTVAVGSSVFAMIT